MESAQRSSGWAFGTWILYWLIINIWLIYGNTWIIYGILWLSIYWEFHHPNWRTPSFFRGVGIPPTSYAWFIRDFLVTTGPWSPNWGKHFFQIFTALDLSGPTLVTPHAWSKKELKNDWDSSDIILWHLRRLNSEKFGYPMNPNDPSSTGAFATLRGHLGLPNFRSLTVEQPPCSLLSIGSFLGFRAGAMGSRLLLENSGVFPWMGGTTKWMVYDGKSQNKMMQMGDRWGSPILGDRHVEWFWGWVDSRGIARLNIFQLMTSIVQKKAEAKAEGK